jgi:ABC-2 type transport system ATP-binding protein
MVIHAENLSKSYGKTTGCREVSFTVSSGSIFGFLGPNGAGKSTVVKLLLGLLRPSRGGGEVLGQPLGHVATRARIGYLPESFRYQDWMRGADLLDFHGRLCRMDKSRRAKRSAAVLEQVGLAGREREKIGGYSKGMQQRIGLAVALLADPELVFLDEPTSALDPIGRKEVRDLILALKAAGKTVFLNSHLLGEVETVCDEIAIIKDGEIVARGRLDELRGLENRLEVRVAGLSAGLLAALRRLDPQLDEHDGEILMQAVDDDAVAACVVSGGGRLLKLHPIRRSLEEVFLKAVVGGSP